MADYSLGELAEQVNGRVVGDASVRITGVGTLTHGRQGQITFLNNPRYRRYLAETQASAVILGEDDVAECPVNALVVRRPYVAYARLTALFAPQREQGGFIHPSAQVSPAATVASTARIEANCVVGAGCSIGEQVRIGPGCVIENDCMIGDGSHLIANVTLYHSTILGQRVTIHAGAVIGSDGFGFANEGGRWIKIHQLGCVRIGDDVEIGANTTIDRGAIEDTIIGSNVILDNLIQIAHNVCIGDGTAMAGCVGVAGSAVIGRNCAIGGGAGILGHLEIADGVTVTAMSLVTKSIKEPGVYSSGTPLEPSAQWQKNYARFKQLDEMARRLRALEHELNELKKG
jgi:UDP-3-O-[3-hydroxymyristoyl] glucosamine N-acyltransferase